MHQMGTVGDMIHMPSLFTCGNHMTKMAEALVVFTANGTQTKMIQILLSKQIHMFSPLIVIIITIKISSTHNVSVVVQNTN